MTSGGCRTFEDLSSVILGSLLASGLACGEDDEGASSDPRVVVGVRIGLGATHRQVLLENASVAAWGAAVYGASGTPADEVASLIPHVVDIGGAASAVVAGEDHACAIVAGCAKCWGRNQYGQLGLGDTENRGDDPGELGEALGCVDLGESRTVEALTTASNSTCALLDGGEVKCWGRNQAGQLGQGHTESLGDARGEMGSSLPCVDLGRGRTVLEIDGGGSFVCALLDDGSVKCWGANHTNFYQLGTSIGGFKGDDPGEMGDALPVVALGTDVIVTTLSAGDTHACVVLEGGGLKCWGHNSEHDCDYDPQIPCNIGQRWGGGRLGYGDLEPRGLAQDMGDNLPLVDVGTDETVLAVDAAGKHTCALLDGGHLKCWGAGQWNALGTENWLDIGDEPGEMGDALPYVDLGTGRTVETFSSYSIINCAALDDGSVKCWGGTEFGGEMGDDLPVIPLP